MRLVCLRVAGLRRINDAELRLGDGVQWLVGPNGSGKSSLLEAVSLLASGRSFRGGSADACIQRGRDALTVYAELLDAGGRHRRIGLRRVIRQGFEARIDGQPVQALSDLFQAFPAVVFPADTGELISGAGEVRRRFLDWGLFHVEQEFYPAWRRYARALRQRNLVLRQRLAGDTERAWRAELVREGEIIHAYREAYLAALVPWVEQIATWLLPGLGAPSLNHRPGWQANGQSLEEALARNLDTDRRLGFTGVGPQRAGWSLVFDALPQRDMYSRGQAKLASMLMLLAQVAQFTEARGEPPVLGLDDALAELDADNQNRLLDYLRQHGVQALLASADRSAVDRLASRPQDVFHVEQGRVAPGV